MSSINSRSLVQKVTVDDFAARLFTTNSKYSEAICPTGVETVCRVLEIGSAGETQKQLQNVLGSSTSIQRLYDIKNSAVITEKTNFKNITGLYTKGNFIKQDFIDKINGVAHIEKWNEPNDAINMVNTFVSNETDGKISDVLSKSDFDEYTRMFTVNVVTFAGQWLKPFDKKKDTERIYTVQGKEIKLQYMHGKKKNAGYFEDSNVQVLELPYADGFSAVFVMPKNGDIRDYVNEEYTLTTQKVKVSLPVFTVSSSEDLTPRLKNLGMLNAFTDDADFSELSSEPNCVAWIKQKINVSFDHSGTIASACTFAKQKALCCRPAIPHFDANRNFMWYVKGPDNSTLFMGYKEIPNQEYVQHPLCKPSVDLHDIMRQIMRL